MSHHRPLQPPDPMNEIRPVQLATLAYLRRGTETLMLHRNKRPGDLHFGRWNGLGGKFSAGETPEMCIRREIFEESGLSVRALKWHGVISFPCFDGVRDWVVFVYTATEFDGTLRDTEEGTLEWIPSAELLNLNLWPGDRKFLPWLDDPRMFSARFIYERGELKGYEVEWYR